MSRANTALQQHSARLETSGPERWELHGELVFDTVPALLEQIEQALPRATSPLVANLAGVTRSDSAGMALLMEWHRLARNRHMALHLEHPPEQLSKLARLTGLAGLLGMED